MGNEVPVATQGLQFQGLRRGVEKVDVIEHYGDPRFPMVCACLPSLWRIAIGYGTA